eukprot:gnl/MRDRNA2_/MRDRNA2_272600_c0_seq1.p1 gnl/MRDRNA2_/MRDRNA2_272600_c0~~gnl/MRDRNA2_/MRDRNA2_272600_c0_seq1.p1  ORF type:complete len:341 (+),score=18.89 gnl/MRDRNA2_/MRDRNA2_272600_c0_seq1:186-1208(+)
MLIPAGLQSSKSVRLTRWGIFRNRFMVFSFALFIMVTIGSLWVTIHFLHMKIDIENDAMMTSLELKSDDDDLHFKSKSGINSSSENFFITRFSDKTSVVSRHQKHIHTVKEYAMLHGYGFVECNLSRIESAIKTTHRLESKLLCVADALHAIPIRAYLVWMDLDIAVCDRSKRLETVIQQHCYFIAQDSHHTVNTGFMLIQNDKRGQNFVQEWVNEFYNNPCSRDIGDQSAVQEVLLKRASIAKGIEYDDSCCSVQGRSFLEMAHKKNLCWNRAMSRLGYPHGNRTVNGMCFLADRWNMHDSGDQYRPGDVLHHTHGQQICLGKGGLTKFPFSYLPDWMT